MLCNGILDLRYRAHVLEKLRAFRVVGGPVGHLCRDDNDSEHTIVALGLLGCSMFCFSCRVLYFHEEVLPSSRRLFGQFEIIDVRSS